MNNNRNVDFSIGISVYIMYFTVILFWSIFGVFIIQNFIFLETDTVVLWQLFTLSLILAFPLPVFFISWYVKQHSTDIITNWELVEREVSISEYKLMAKEYNAAYPQLMTNISPLRVVITVILGILTLSIPIQKHLIPYQALFFAPFTFGILLIFLGIALIFTLLPAAPSSLSSEFPYQSIKKYVNGAKFLYQVPGIYWIGIRLIVGKWAGYYTLRDPSLSARVEGIESIVVMICQLDTDGTISEVQFLNQSNHTNFPITDPIPNPSVETLKASVLEILNWYIELSDDKDILKEIIDELSSV
ncbi:MAG: hypothetical protein ACFFF4_05355 [Candidatus Thorarchaeota archaeon]